MKDRTRTWRLPMLDLELLVTLTEDIAVARQKLSDEFGFEEADTDDATGFYTVDYNANQGHHYIFINRNSPLKLNIIAHEVLHMVTWIDSWYGIDSEEFRAYLQGWLTEEIYRWTCRK